MNYPKINMILLIVVIIALAAILYFLFINKKDTNAQNGLLTDFMKKFFGEEKSEVRSQKSEVEQPKEPTEDDWKKIYAISEKIYNEEQLTKEEEKFQKKFPEQIAADVEYCGEFYPIVEKLFKGEELNEGEKEFYEPNKEDVDKQVDFRKLLIIINKIADNEPLNEDEKLMYDENKESIDKKVEYKKKLTGLVDKGIALGKSSPPLEIEKRNKTILGLFEDKVPKKVNELRQLLIEKTGKDYQKNMYRILEPLEKGDLLLAQKIKNIAYYGLSEWFDGTKLKPEFKKKIAA